MSSPLAAAQNLPEAGVAGFSGADKDKIRAFSVPGEEDMSRRDPRFYPRRPVIDVKQWYSDHWAKLRSLLMAEGMY